MYITVYVDVSFFFFFFFSSRRRHTRWPRDWSSDVCSSDLARPKACFSMEKQAFGLAHGPNLTLIDDADRPAKWYFQLKAAHLESKRTGAPMRHPLDGPVTLRWRS